MAQDADKSGAAETGKAVPKDAAAALATPVTVDFMKADLDWVLNTLFVVTGTNIITDPNIDDSGKSAVTIHAVELPLKDLLTAICRQNNLKWELDGNAVRVFVPAERLARIDQDEQQSMAREFELRKAGRLHLKFPKGGELNLEGSAVGKFPQLLDAAIDRIAEPGQDGLLAYHVKLGNSAEIKAMLAESAPKAVVNYYNKLQLLVVTSEDPAQLRRVNTIFRALELGRRQGE